MFGRGLDGYRRNLLPLSAAGAATFAVYAAFRIPSQLLDQDGQTAASVALDLVGLVVAGAIALPWFALALRASRGTTRSAAAEPTNSLQLVTSRQLATMAVCGFWFWAAFMLGLRYLGGIPSLLTVIYYAFYGFVVAENSGSSARQALGLSVRLGNKRRIGLFAIAVLFGLFNLCGMFTLGLGVNPLTITGAVIGLLLTTNVTLVGGAALYDVLVSDLPENQ